jgi:4'-phosphopantetheinyl transferase
MPIKNKILIYLLFLDDAPLVEIDDYLPYVSKNRKERIDRYLFYEDKLLSLVSELMLRYVINKEAFLEIQDIAFEYNNYGKPFLKNNSDIFFNFSHTKNAIALAIAPNEIGVDIEKMTKNNMVISSKILAEEEINILNQSQDRIHSFFYYWTMKEAFSKYVGKGLSLDFKSIKVNQLCKEKNIVYINRCFKEYMISVYSPVKLPEIIQTLELEEVLSIKSVSEKQKVF